MSQPRSRRFREFVRTQVAPFALMLAIMGTFRSAVADWNTVPTGSMNPTIVEGDRILVNKLAYGLRVPFTPWYVARWSEPVRGEVVVFASPADGKRLVKRVIGLPGETVELVENRLFIDGKPSAYQWNDWGGPGNGRVLATETTTGGTHPLLLTPGAPARRNFGPITVPAGHYFMLGDNRDNSADSRYFGFVPADRITGRSSAVVLSLDPSTYAPRWNRTMAPLP
ncbi:MAG TPA: signal peptidase I [Tepidisphaeraceae bacterium]|nr:signal peptidase I [Tepidisphaeraceae bacterium]